MLRTVSFLLLLGMLVGVCSVRAADNLKLAVVPSDNEIFSDYEVLGKYQALSKYLSAQIGMPITFTPVASTFVAAKRASRGEYDMIMAPGHTIASVLKAGFTPVGKEGGDVRTVFVAAAGAKWNTIKDATGAKLGLPPFESLQAGLARGELNSTGVETKRHFQDARFFRDQQAELFALEINSMDLAAVDSGLAEKWLKSHQGKIIQKTPGAPRMAFAVNSKRVAPELEKKIEGALLKYAEVGAEGRGRMVFSPTKREEFASISSMLNTTPKELAGARVIEVKEAAELIAKGVPLVDARVESDYLDGHIKGALWIPYQEVSAKEVGFDPVDDKFDLSRLPQDKNAPMMLYCDGTPCWKSYKASILAMKSGYKNVYWFRGGYPDWKAAGYPVEVGRPK